jgi:hypothetical protein
MVIYREVVPRLMEVIMNSHGSWTPYSGSGSIILAFVLLIITCIFVFAVLRLRQPISIKPPGKATGFLIVLLWFLSVITFLIGATTYVLVLKQQVAHITAPANPITPITETCAIVTFVVIAFLTRRGGVWTALESAIVGTIAAPLIFELPFDLIVMWHTFPPTPHMLFTLLYFLPLFMVEIASFAMLTFSPLLRVSRYTLLSLAALFLVFAIWALFGFAYPYAPIDIAMNVISKIIAFAVAISLFLPQRQHVQQEEHNPEKTLSEAI